MKLIFGDEFVVHSLAPEAYNAVSMVDFALSWQTKQEETDNEKITNFWGSLLLCSA